MLDKLLIILNNPNIIIVITLLTFIVALLTYFINYKMKQYIENSNLTNFNKNLIDGKLVFITALKEVKENKVVFDFAVETLLNICENGCFFYYKGHYNKGDFIKLFKDDIIKYYTLNYADISNVKLNKDYPNLVKFYLEHKKTNH